VTGEALDGEEERADRLADRVEEVETAPVQTVLWVMSQTWYMTVTMVMNPPSTDTVRPISSRRNTGDVRNGRTSINVRVSAGLMRA
jgi:hypothetical protein